MIEEMKLNAVVSGLADYVDQVGKGEIIKALAGSAPSIQYFATLAGVNQVTDIHLMEASGSFGDGKNCEVTDNTTVTFTDRQLDPAIVKQEFVLCKEELRGKWLAYQDKISASHADEIPFEQAMIEAFQKSVKDNLENTLWNGITVGAKTFKGFADIVKAEGIEVKAGANASVYDMCVALIKAAPAKVRKNIEIFMSEDNMLALKEELLKNDFRLFDLASVNGALEDKSTIKLPVYGTLIHEVSALNADENVYGFVPAHAIYGYSVSGDATDIVVAYDAYTEKTVIRARLAVATQMAYPGTESLVAKAID